MEIRSYPSLFNLGHKALEELLSGPVLIEEKVDGSQLSFGVYVTEGGGAELRIRSKGAKIWPEDPPKMFRAGVNYILQLAKECRLIPNWTYRVEYLEKPKHNALKYDRIPKNHMALFDVDKGDENYCPQAHKANVAEILGVDLAPALGFGTFTAKDIPDFLEHDSFLGGTKIEGVVIKNYLKFGLDKKILIGKLVSPAFREVHAREWKSSNPGKGDVVQRLIDAIATPARWQKAIIHLREEGLLVNGPQDIGILMAEIKRDVEKEEKEWIMEKIYKDIYPHVIRGAARGFPEWYKAKLQEGAIDV